MRLSRHGAKAFVPLCRTYYPTSTTQPSQSNVLKHFDRKQKAEGSIADVFTSLTGEKTPPLPPRFADLKKALWKESLVQSWREVLSELQVTVQRVSLEGGNVTVYFMINVLVNSPAFPSDYS